LVAIGITDPDMDRDCDTGKTCLGGGMHCPVLLVVYLFIYLMNETMDPQVSDMS